MAGIIDRVVVNGGTNQVDDVKITLDGEIPAVSQSGTWNITNISGTLSLPTGASTSANQTTIIGHLDGVEGLLTTLAGAVSGTEMQVDVLTLPTLPAGTNYIGKTRLTDGTTDAEVVPLTGYNAQAVAIVDGSGNQITTFGGGVQYTEADTDASITGTAMLMESGGDVLVPLQGNMSDGLLVNLGTNNDVTITSGTITDITNPITVNSHAVTNAGTFAVQVDGAALTSLQLLDDVVVVLGTDTYTEASSKGYVIGAVRRDADTTLVNTTNEYGPLQMDANGRLKVEVFSGETLPVSLTSTTITGTVAVTQSGTWDEVGINDSGNSITVDAPVGTPVNVQIGNATLSAGVVDETGASAVDALAVGGGTPHDAVDSGNPQKIGFKAVAHGANPTAVAAGDRTDAYSNRAGVQFVIGGHPNMITRTVYISDATGAQTDASIVGTIAAGAKVVVTAVTVTVDSAVTATGGVAVKLGFGATTIPADSSTGANGILLDHKGIAAGSGIALGNGGGILGVGADGEELRLTCEDPVGGGLSVQISYYTIES